MDYSITNREKDYNFLRFLSLFGGCCSLKGFAFYNDYSLRHAKREVSKYLNLNILDALKFSDDEYLRSRGVGNIYFPKKKISQIFKVNRYLSTDPEKIILRNLRFLTACTLRNRNINPISFYEKKNYFNVIKLENNLEFIKYITRSNMDEPVTEEFICICLPSIWSVKKCVNIIVFWKNIIKDYNLSLFMNVFSMSPSFNKKIKNSLGDIDVKIVFDEIIIDNFEKNYTNYLLKRNLDSLTNNEDWTDL